MYIPQLKYIISEIKHSLDRLNIRTEVGERFSKFENRWIETIHSEEQREKDWGREMNRDRKKINTWRNNGQIAPNFNQRYTASKAVKLLGQV